MASRLDRLFVLLESGSSSVTRKAAAQQLGEVQRMQPHELHHLLARVYCHLKSTAWETRIAAGQAIEAILKNVPQWNPTSCENDKETETFESGRLRFDTFDIEKVLVQGAHLMGSEGKEYDMEEDSLTGMDMREKLARQRQLLNARLGLDVVSKLGMDMSDLFSNEDLMSHASAPPTPTTPSVICSSSSPPKLEYRRPVSELVPRGVPLSSREMNRARRKARQLKGSSIDDGSVTPTSSSSMEPDRKRFKPDATTRADDNLPIYGEWTPDVDGSWGPEVSWWPLEGWAGALATDLFSSQWETRHGAATALRDMLRSHGKGAGRERGTSASQMEEMHQGWLEDISLRLLCVLALDRFGDFVTDQMVAPVRETCAQCLGVAASLMGPKGAGKMVSALSMLAKQSTWEARHGAHLGLKYLIAVQQELGQQTLAFPSVVQGLWDPIDDVAAAAAAALIGGVQTLVKELPQTLPAIVGRLRYLLSSQDELAAACGNYMALLAAILAEPETNAILGPKYLASVVPRLWPFLSHPTSSVRRAALQTLRTLTLCPGLLFQSSTVENEPKTEPNDSHTDSNNVINNDVKSHNGNVKTEIKVEDGTKDVIETKCKSNGADVCEEWLKNLHNTVETQSDEPCSWNANLLQQVLRHVFQRVLVEHINNIQIVAEEVWNNLVRCSNLEMLLHASCPYVSPFMCLTMQPAKISFDPLMLIHSRTFSSESLGGDTHLSSGVLSQKWYVGGSETTPLSVREANVTRTRCIASRMLGLLSCYVIQPAPGIIYTPEMESPINCYVKLLLVYLSSKSSLQRMVVGLVVSSWAQQDKSVRPAPPDLVNKLHECLMQPIYFDEIAVACTRILQEARDFIALMKHYKICVEDDGYSNIISLEQVIQFMGQHCHDLLNTTKVKRNKVTQSFEDRRKNILNSAIQCSTEQSTLSLATLAALAGAVANLNALPEKLNPVIKPLMESIKKEENEHLQLVSADNLAQVLKLCVDRQPSPNPKVLNNLCNFLRSDSEFTPKIIQQPDSSSNGDAASDESGVESKNKQIVDNIYHGILTLSIQRRKAERAVFRRANSTASTSGTSRGPGRPPASDIPLEELFPVEDDVQKQCRIQRRGATMALTSLAKCFGAELMEKLPKLWEIITAPLTGATVNVIENDPISLAEDIVTNLQVLEVVAPAIDKTILPNIMQHLEGLTNLLENPYMAVRHMASRCLAVLASIDPPAVMQIVVDVIIPMLGVADVDRRRLSVQGAAEALTCIVDKLQINIVPYIVFLVVPLLGRMSDHDEDVRLMSTHCFATLIQLMPLEGAIKEPAPLSVPLAEQRARDKSFLEQLFNPKSIGNYVVPVPITAELRSYQQAGINWLAFLNRYQLHGVLCDDMGLGKTLQSICMVAGDHHQRQIKYKETKSPDCAPLPSLVICPPTLTGHWVYEVKKFMSTKYLNPLHYTGPPLERERLRSKVRNHNMVVASYDIVRKDIEFFSSIRWNYCILDEGHIIKNGKTKASKAIKTLIANHRLILSGTPIQNNVLELWSLFDFLMPGLLGTERQFTARYSRPILASRDPKATPQQQEAGALAMEALHRQVLPFLLRRMKEDVLTELPPKITQDYYCELSPLQRRLYEDFSRTHMPNGLPEGKHHVFQALRYLQNVCNHPKLVLTPQHPEYPTVTQELSRMNSNLNDIQHSAKLTALKQLLQDCGIGCPSGETTGVLSQHRALVFCQLKIMLDVLEKDLLRPLLPHVSYLRLDGSVAPGQRQQLVQRFNNDPSIDILLLTTQVGGLGLNLTGADTVIFVEHDWNPMKDLQAMDRAHRIGQKKVVNVYRLITKSTLEEKIMCLQKFKLLTANTVISGENASLETMGTDQLLDLFHLDGDNKKNSTIGSGPTTIKTILENLPELWDDQQYENEYDMTQFVQNLKKK